MKQQYTMTDLFFKGLCVGIGLGIWFGFRLKKIRDEPYEVPETTRQYLSQMEPKCKVCIYCDDPPLPGRYFCDEHIFHEKASV